MKKNYSLIFNTDFSDIMSDHDTVIFERIGQTDLQLVLKLQLHYFPQMGCS